VTTVQTALGPVEAAKLGRVLMHEHVFVMTADVQQNYPDEWGDEDERVADAVRKLSELPKHGIGTIVDVTVVGQGRDIARIKRIAEQVPELNIVVATGIYTFDEVPLFFSRRPKETMTDFFVRDITEGIAGTGVRAGMLKCAVDERGLTAGVERVLRSVARAHAATGVPITTTTCSAVPTMAGSADATRRPAPSAWPSASSAPGSANGIRPEFTKATAASLRS